MAYANAHPDLKIIVRRLLKGFALQQISSHLIAVFLDGRVALIRSDWSVPMSIARHENGRSCQILLIQQMGIEMQEQHAML